VLGNPVVLLKAACTYVLGRLSASGKMVVGKMVVGMLVLVLLAVWRFDCLSAAPEGVGAAAADLCCSDSCFMLPAREAATGIYCTMK
jgi:hypothetical protein